MSIETQLDRFEIWLAKLRSKHQVDGSMADFCKGGLSSQGLRDWMRRAHLTFPFLPWKDEDDEGSLLLSWVIWAQPPYDITWASPSLYRVLGDLRRAPRPMPQPRRRAADEDKEVPTITGDDLINGRACVELLYGQDKLTRDQHRLLKALRSDPNCWQESGIARLLKRTDGGLIPVEVTVTYTGANHDKFFCSARITGPVRWPPAAKKRAQAAPVEINTTGEIVHWTTTRQLPFTLQMLPATQPLHVSAYNPPAGQFIVNPPPPGQFVLNPIPAGQFVFSPTPTITYDPTTGRVSFEAQQTIEHKPSNNGTN